jgi:hypothetical protein
MVIFMKRIPEFVGLSGLGRCVGIPQLLDGASVFCRMDDVGLNLGAGFGDTSVATENCLILDGKIHKLGKVTFDYDPSNYDKTWCFHDDQERLKLDFLPFKGRLARTNLGIIFSEVHQMFGRYTGEVRR